MSGFPVKISELSQQVERLCQEIESLTGQHQTEAANLRDAIADKV